MDSVHIESRTGTDACAAARDHLRRAQERDPIGHRVHTAFACAYALSLPVAPALEAVSFALLVGFALLRLPRYWRSLGALVRPPALLFWFAWALVHALSISWSIDPVEDWTELKAMRALLLIPALWPVLAHVPWFLASFLVGVVVTNVVQAGQFLDLIVTTDDPESRARGLLHPIQAGAFALAGLTCATTALLRVPRVKPGARAGTLAALGVAAAMAAFGLVAAGSRGPWLGAALVLPVATVIVAMRQRISRRAALAMAGAGLVLGTGLWFANRDFVHERVSRAVAEWRVVQREGYATGVGQRVVMARWAWEFFRDSPFHGTGAGSFRELTRLTPEYRQILDDNPAMHRRIERGEISDGRITAAHPHSIYLHVLSSTGLLGFLPFAGLLTCACLIAARGRRDHLFADAPLFILAGWLIGAAFDCYNLNGHLNGLFAFSIACAWPARPALQCTTLIFENAADHAHR